VRLVFLVPGKTGTMPCAYPPSLVTGGRRPSPRRPAPKEDAPMARRPLVLLASLALVAVAATPVVAKNPNAVNAYRVTVLQSDATDANLVNGWGIVSGPATPWWVSNN